MERLLYWLSGEFLLEGRPNGGTAVLMRSLMVTVVLYLPALALRSYCEKDALFQFSLVQLRAEVHETIPWIGAIFGGAYAALYTRFAAQWSYLAGLYNQIMATNVTATGSAHNQRAMDTWKAGFIEDAQDLHLASKSMFKGVIEHYLSQGDMVHTFIDATDGTGDRVRKMEKELGIKAAAPTPPSWR